MIGNSHVCAGSNVRSPVIGQCRRTLTTAFPDSDWTGYGSANSFLVNDVSLSLANRPAHHFLIQVQNQLEYVRRVQQTVTGVQPRGGGRSQTWFCGNFVREVRPFACRNLVSRFPRVHSRLVRVHRPHCGKTPSPTKLD